MPGSGAAGDFRSAGKGRVPLGWLRARTPTLRFGVSVAPNPLNPDAIIIVSTGKIGFLRVRLFDVGGHLPGATGALSSAALRSGSSGGCGAYDDRVCRHGAFFACGSRSARAYRPNGTGSSYCGLHPSFGNGVPFLFWPDVPRRFRFALTYTGAIGGLAESCRPSGVSAPQRCIHGCSSENQRGSHDGACHCNRRRDCVGGPRF